MTKKIYVFLIAFLAIGILKAQVPPADSLTGTYIGLLYYANPYTNPWTITQDTLYASNIDSTNCKIQINYSPYFGYPTYYTDYYSCNSIAPSNYYTKFYGGDSVRVIDDQVAEPPPNQPISYRFFGKRISNKTVGIKELLNNMQLIIYPNPTTKDLTIEIPQKAIIEILNIDGQVIMTTAIIDRKAIIDLEGLSSGVYIIKATTDKGVVIKKFIKE